jgi:hypothetical protein
MLRAGLGLLLVLFAVAPSVAHEYAAKGVTVAHPWARATPGGAEVGAAYLEIKAARGAADRLVAARSPAARTVELHTHRLEGNVMRMRRIDAIPIAAGKSVVLAPGGHHIMLMGLIAPLKEGDLLKLSLVFEKAGEIEVEATVEPMGATGPHGFDHQPGTKPPPKAGQKGSHHH